MLLTKSNLGKASDKELNQAAEAIKAEQAKRVSNSKERALKALKAVAAKHGLTLESLLGGKPAKATRAKKGVNGRRRASTARYANPAKTSQTWSGMGRRPMWVIKALEEGRSLESLAVTA